MDPPGQRPRSRSRNDRCAGRSHRLLTLPSATVVHTGHGDDTTIGAEAPQLDDWVVRGH